MSNDYNGWLPTPENINALPSPLRLYIHDIEAIADPAGIVAASTLLKAQNTMLVSQLTKQQEPCGWMWNDGTYYSECGGSCPAGPDEGIPEGFNYCPKCGKKISEV